MTMYEELKRQLIEEIGEDEWENTDVKPEKLYILSQKFGMRVPVLTQSEVYLIYKEQGFKRGHRKYQSRNQRNQTV